MHAVIAALALLTGIHTVYIDADARAKHDMASALKKELPQVRVVSRSSAADAVLDLRFAGFVSGGRSAAAPAGDQTVLVSVGGRVEEQAVPTPQLRTSYSTFSDPVSRSSAVVRLRNGNEMVIHEGFDSPSFSDQAAARFIRAWREANP
ncbi:MAG TPA: hypothetical protein VLV78_16220 [Thermoanaerobaculia bacterium]|nr:hypothetical protein [Thermoanaerobaculia bacterium]